MSNVFDIYRAANATAEVLPDIPEGRSYRVQAKPTAHTPVQRWAYPFALRDKATPETMYTQLKAIATMRHGFFPLSSNGYPNGSLHFGKACKDALDYDAGFRCIADGEIIAYRLDKQLQVLDYGPDPDQRVIEYSLGFVLVRHWLPLPPAPANTSAQPATTQPSAQATEKPAAAHDEGIYLYSLYSYNRPLNHYRKESKSVRKEALPFWQGERVFHVSVRCTDKQAPPPLQETPQWLIDQHKWEGLPPPPPPPLPPFYDFPPIVGRRIRAAGNGKAEILGILHQGAEFTVEGDRTTGWAQLRTLRSGDPFPAVKNEVVPDEAMRGWVWLEDMDSAIDPAPDTLDKVVVLDKPYPVKAGERLGFLGENPASQHAAPRPGIMNRDPAMALEVFAGEDFPAYLAQARERTAALPDTEKTVLTIEARSQGVRHPRAGDDLLLGTQMLVPEPDSPPGAYVRGKRYHIVPTPPEAKPKTDAPAKKTTGFRCSANGWERIEAAKFAKLPPAEQATYPCEEVLELADDRLLWGPRNAPVNRQHMLWHRHPLDMAGQLAPIPSPMAIPRSELDALPADRKAIDANGVRWWKIDVSGKDCVVKLWVAEKGMPGVSWQSPQAWPAFHIVDGTTFSFLEAFQRHAVITGKVRPEDEQSFTATTNALAHSEFIVELERAIDDSTEKDGRIHGRDLAVARTKPLLAHALSRMIVRFESQWSTDQARWAALDEILGHDWKGERERQTKRGWWNEVASSIDSFPQDPRVYHVHPYGWIDNFQSQRGSINADKFIHAYKPLHASLGVIDDGAIVKISAMNEVSETNLRRLLLSILALYDEISEEPFIPHIAYMLATVRHESYNPYEQTFFSPIDEKISEEKAERNYGSGPKARDAESREKAKLNGNVKEGDGYKYRGRGFVQLTWKNNYLKHTKSLGVDLVSSPELANKWDVAARIMFDGMRKGTFRTRSSLFTHINDRKIDYVLARDIINGDTKVNGGHIATFAKAFEECLYNAID